MTLSVGLDNKMMSVYGQTIDIVMSKVLTSEKSIS